MKGLTPYALGHSVFCHYYPGKEDSHAGAVCSPTRQRGKSQGTLAGASGWYVGPADVGSVRAACGGTVAGASDWSVTFFLTWVITSDAGITTSLKSRAHGDEGRSETRPTSLSWRPATLSRASVFWGSRRNAVQASPSAFLSASSIVA